MLFFLLALCRHEVCDALLDSEGGESGLAAVQPALLDDLRHAVKHLHRERERRQREGERGREG